MGLIKDSSIPLYKQLKNNILEEIKSKSLKSDSRISSEREYSEKYNISRVTARHAIDELVQEKYLIRIVGKGTYITNIDKSSEFTHIVSFTDDMRRQEYSIYSKVLKFEVINPTDKLIKNLRIKKSDKIFRLNRLRFANNILMAIQESFIVYDYCPTLSNYNFSNDSLYRVLEGVFDLKLSYANNILGARLAKEEEVRLFKLKKLIPVFVLDQTTFLEDGNPIEFVRSIYRCDKYSFFNIALGREISK